MLKSLQLKILIGFMLLVLLLIMAGGYSIYEFSQLNKTANTLVDESYNSLGVFKKMSESLENEDGAILLLILGNWEAGMKKLQSADSTFMDSFNKASNHLNIPNETEYLKKLYNSYQIYKKNWNRPIAETERQGNINWYFESIHMNYLTVKADLNALVELNQLYMYNEATNIRNNSKRAIMPGIIAILSAILYLFMLNFFIAKYVIFPVNRITDAANRFVLGIKSFDAKITSNDEIKNLEKSIRALIEKLTNRMT